MISLHSRSWSSKLVGQIELVSARSNDVFSSVAVRVGRARSDVSAVDRLSLSRSLSRLFELVGVFGKAMIALLSFSYDLARPRLVNIPVRYHAPEVAAVERLAIPRYRAAMLTQTA